MVMLIELCIPVVSQGIRYLENFLTNVFETASGIHEIKISVSFHTRSDLDAIQQCSVANFITNAFYAEPKKAGQFAGSASHCSALNVLSEKATGEVVVLSDYDMAFLQHNWDTALVHELGKTDLVGIDYGQKKIKFLNLSGTGYEQFENRWVSKYQGNPNLSFFAATRETLCLLRGGGHLSDLDEFLMKGGCPFSYIEDSSSAQLYQLEFGDLFFRDTGYDLPKKIKALGLSKTIIGKATPDDSRSLFPAGFKDQINPVLYPEVFMLDQAPFLYHFKKGTLKSSSDSDKSAFEGGKLEVSLWLGCQPR
jgi:hypothetical protein